MNATGDVYNLTDVSKFAGTYVAAEAGLTLAGGMGGWSCGIRTAWSFTCVPFLRAPNCN